jgi:hypothetical protein
MERAMRTELMGPMDSEMIEEIAHASKRFLGATGARHHRGSDRGTRGQKISGQTT